MGCCRVRTELGCSGTGWGGGWGNERVRDVGQDGVGCCGGEQGLKDVWSKGAQSSSVPGNCVSSRRGGQPQEGVREQPRGGCSALVSLEPMSTQEPWRESCARAMQLCTG